MQFLSASFNQSRLWRMVFAIVLLFAARPPAAAQDVSTEYKFKAVFLFHFAQFVDWPTNAFSDPKAPLEIGILGDDPFDDFLDQTVQGENVNGHPLVIQRFHNPNDIKDCQILFISQSENRQLGRILDSLKGKTVLTVSDINNFPENGGMIGFVTIQDKIHFRINTDAAHDANLTLSSKLLRLAQIVTPQNR